MHGLTSGACSLAVHPYKPILAITGAEGWVMLWDYEKKSDLVSNMERWHKDINRESGTPANRVFTASEFTPDGSELLIAQVDGEIAIIDTKNDSSFG